MTNAVQTPTTTPPTAFNLSNPSDDALRRGIGLAMYPAAKPAYPGGFIGQWSMVWDMNLHSPARFPSTDTVRRVAHVHPGRPADHAEHRPHETTVHACTVNPGDSASSAGDKESTD